MIPEVERFRDAWTRIRARAERAHSCHPGNEHRTVASHVMDTVMLTIYRPLHFPFASQCVLEPRVHASKPAPSACHPGNKHRTVTFHVMDTVIMISRRMRRRGVATEGIFRHPDTQLALRLCLKSVAPVPAPGN